jgi:L-lactate dehydrogenase complex protein LldG
MATDLQGMFGEALRAHHATLTRTDPDGFTDALSELIEPPAVGVPLPFEGCSFDGLDIETDLTTAAIEEARTGVCAAGFAVAAYGTVVLQPTAAGEEPVSLFPSRHVVVVHERDLLPDLASAFERLADEFEAGRDDAILATGPSATADMGDIVLDVHGPSEVHVVLVEEAA